MRPRWVSHICVQYHEISDSFATKHLSILDFGSTESHLGYCGSGTDTRRGFWVANPKQGRVIPKYPSPQREPCLQHFPSRLTWCHSLPAQGLGSTSSEQLQFWILSEEIRSCSILNCPHALHKAPDTVIQAALWGQTWRNNVLHHLAVWCQSLSLKAPVVNVSSSAIRQPFRFPSSLELHF